MSRASSSHNHEFPEGLENVEPLGSGGFGDVYRAVQASTGQSVAIKFSRLDPEAPAEKNRRIRTRFERETRICSKLHHPHIVRLLDAGYTTASGEAYAVYEFVPGVTLERYLHDMGALDVEETRALMGQVLDAVACAHRNGVLHRDLKPANIMVSKSGVRLNTKILDFGIGIATASEGMTGIDRVTLTNESLGTPQYVAPEQLRGETPSTSSDLYSWGLVFLECLLGRPVIQAKHVVSAFEEHLSPSEHILPGPLASHALGAFLRRVLRKNPAERERDAGQLWEKLQQLHLIDLVGKIELQSDKSQPEAGATMRTAPVGVDKQIGEAAADVGRSESQYQQLVVASCSLRVVATSVQPANQDSVYATQNAELTRAKDTIAKFGGHILGSFDDQLLAVFGHPHVTGSEARRAASASLELVANLRASSIPPSGSCDWAFDARVGLHVGPLRLGGGAQSFGVTTGIAQRLREQASVNEILASPEFQRLLGHRMEFAPGKEFSISEAGPAICSFQLVGELEAEAVGIPSRTDGLTVVSHGRREEVKLLEDKWSNVRAGNSAVVLLHGDAGMGKSFICSGLRRLVVEHQSGWFQAQCLAENANRGLHPIIRLIRQRLGLELERTPNDAADNLTRYAMRQGVDEIAHLHQLCRWFSLPPVTPDGAAARLQSETSPDQSISAILSSLRKLVRGLFEECPGVLLIEDLHWADPTTLQFIEHLTCESETPGLFILLTSRETHADGWPGTRAERRRLNRIDDEHARALVESRLEAVSPSSAVVARIVELGDGVPLFLHELASAHLLDGVDTSDVGPSNTDSVIPFTLQSLLAARLAKLGPALPIAQLASVIGRSFDERILSMIAQRPTGVLNAELQDLVDAGFVVRLRRADTTEYVFRHALIREAVYESQSASERALAHAQIANAMRGLPTRPQPEILAHHHERAGELIPSSRLWLRVARAHVERNATVEATRILEHALERIDCAPSTDDELEGAELSLRAELTPLLQKTRGYASGEVMSNVARHDTLYMKMLGSDAHTQLVDSLQATWQKIAAGAMSLQEPAIVQSIASLQELPSEISARNLLFHTVTALYDFWCGRWGAARTQFMRAEQHRAPRTSDPLGRVALESELSCRVSRSHLAALCGEEHEHLMSEVRDIGAGEFFQAYVTAFDLIHCLACGNLSRGNQLSTELFEITLVDGWKGDSQLSRVAQNLSDPEVVKYALIAAVSLITRCGASSSVLSKEERSSTIRTAFDFVEQEATQVVTMMGAYAIRSCVNLGLVGLAGELRERLNSHVDCPLVTYLRPDILMADAAYFENTGERTRAKASLDIACDVTRSLRDASVPDMQPSVYIARLRSLGIHV